jgi:hypothetical protein
MVNAKATIGELIDKAVFEVSVMCSEVITNRQKPSRLADVRNICWEVLLAEIILVLK